MIVSRFTCVCVCMQSEDICVTENTREIIIKINIWLVAFAPTSSGTFSHSPLVTAAFSSASFLAGFCLSFLLNENERNDKNRFFGFSFFAFLALSVAGVDAAFASSPPSTTSLLSFNVVAVVSLTLSVSLPFSATSDGFSSAFGEFAAGASPAAPFSVASTATDWSSFSVALSLAFSASSLSDCFWSPAYFFFFFFVSISTYVLEFIQSNSHDLRIQFTICTISVHILTSPSL